MDSAVLQDFTLNVGYLPSLNINVDYHSLIIIKKLIAAPHRKPNANRFDLIIIIIIIITTIIIIIVIIPLFIPLGNSSSALNLILFVVNLNYTC